MTKICVAVLVFVIAMLVVIAPRVGAQHTTQQQTPTPSLPYCDYEPGALPTPQPGGECVYWTPTYKAHIPIVDR